MRAPIDSCPAFDRRPAVLILPGGGYEYCSQREGEPAAMQFLAAGYQAFVLEYSTAEHAANWQPMIDAARAIVWMRSHAGALGLLPDKIAVCGFSAGGHLAAGTAILWDAGPVQAALGADAGQNRPDAVVLSYPVVTSGPYGHQGSFDCIAGGGRRPAPAVQPGKAGPPRPAAVFYLAYRDRRHRAGGKLDAAGLRPAGKPGAL